MDEVAQMQSKIAQEKADAEMWREKAGVRPARGCRTMYRARYVACGVQHVERSVCSRNRDTSMIIVRHII